MRENIMFKSFAITNFGSYRERVEFTTKANDKKDEELLESHTFEAKEERFNKVSYILGTNGSGKSSFIKAVYRFQTLLALGALSILPADGLNLPQELKDSINQKENTFLLDDFSYKEPTTYEISFIVGDTEYNYIVAIKDSIIEREYLSKKVKRTEILLDRNINNDEVILKGELKNFKPFLDKVKDNALLISVAAFLNIETAQTVVNQIVATIQVRNANVLSMNFPTKDSKDIKQMIEEDPRMLDFIQRLNSNVSKLEFEYEENDIAEKVDFKNDIENRKIIAKEVKHNYTAVYNVFNKNGNKTENILRKNILQFESLGINKVFSLLPQIFWAIDTGGTLIIDEIENGINPKVLDYIVNIFQDCDINKNNAQIVLLTHHVLFLNNTVRRDQIWFVDKDDFGVSQMFSLDSKAVRGNDNLFKKLMSGQISGIDFTNL